MARIPEVARYFDVGRTTVFQWLKLGLLAYVNLPGQDGKTGMRRIPWAAVELAGCHKGTGEGSGSERRELMAVKLAVVPPAPAEHAARPAAPVPDKPRRKSRFKPVQADPVTLSVGRRLTPGRTVRANSAGVGRTGLGAGPEGGQALAVRLCRAQGLVRGRLPGATAAEGRPPPAERMTAQRTGPLSASPLVLAAPPSKPTTTTPRQVRTGP